MVQCEKCAKSRQVTEPDRRILREAPFQIVRQRLTPGRISGEGQGKRSAILHLPALGKLTCGHRVPPGLRRIPEKAFPQCQPGSIQSRPVPLYVFYFPLPALFVAAFSVVFPYAVAFKLVTVLGPVTLPVAAWAFGRLADFKRPIPALMAMATLPFLFNTSYTIEGGNLDRKRVV